MRWEDAGRAEQRLQGRRVWGRRSVHFRLGLASAKLILPRCWQDQPGAEVHPGHLPGLLCANNRGHLQEGDLLKDPKLAARGLHASHHRHDGQPPVPRHAETLHIKGSVGTLKIQLLTILVFFYRNFETNSKTKSVKDKFKLFKYFLRAVSYFSFPFVLLLLLRTIFSKSKFGNPLHSNFNSGSTLKG